MNGSPRPPRPRRSVPTRPGRPDRSDGAGRPDNHGSPDGPDGRNPMPHPRRSVPTRADGPDGRSPTRPVPPPPAEPPSRRAPGQEPPGRAPIAPPPGRPPGRPAHLPGPGLPGRPAPLAAAAAGEGATPPPGTPAPLSTTATTTSTPTGPRKRKRRLLLGLVAVVVVAGLAGGAWWTFVRDDPTEDLGGLLYGSVETPGHESAAGADVVVSPVGDGERELARTVTDDIGLFEVDLGGHEGPVVVRASLADQQAATVVAVSPDSLTTGIRLVVGAPGTGVVEGQVVAAEGTPLEGTGTVEARFVETGRTDVTALGPDARFRFDALPLDGDLILVATTASGTHQGLTATVVSESLTSNVADITLRSPADPGAANQVDEPEIVTEDLDDWVLDGPVEVVPAG
jgi:hypothetical protein